MVIKAIVSAIPIKPPLFPISYGGYRPKIWAKPPSRKRMGGVKIIGMNHL